MILDFRNPASGTAFDTDLCIVGSGAAGLSLAHLLGGALRVLVVEAGDRDPPAGTDDFLAGEAADFPFAGFTAGRRRAFGGATRAWFGQCLRFEPIDFAPRDWVAHSGWPLDRAALDPFYDRAEQVLRVGTPAAATCYDAGIWQAAGLAGGDAFAPHIVPRFTVYCPQPDFTRLFGRHYFRDHPAVTVLLNAAATGIALAASGERVAGLRVRGEDGHAGGGRHALVQARAFVLCGGGIENPRLLLASRDVQRAGIGNAHDLVGRFFQDHPSADTGSIATLRPRALQARFRKRRHGGLLVWPKLALTEAAQRDGRLLNATSLLRYDYNAVSALTRAKSLAEAVQARRPAAVAREALRLLPALPELAARGAHTLATGQAPVFTASRIWLKAHIEQVPDPANRITLADACDRFGVPRARLHWRTNALELATMRAITAAVGEALARQGYGEMTPAAWLDAGEAGARDAFEDNYHHAGTTRMATTPAAGVVDPDCRVFGVDNLYVAGGSVFPTSGYANPTLTIVALAIRLADLLRRRLAP
jgi:choline dehydrogenase-like flavoprotein